MRATGTVRRADKTERATFISLNSRAYKPRWRVQAQRKFAQGAYIPPQNNFPRSDDTTTVTPTKEDRTGVIQMARQNAKSLLDLVSFKRVHTHFDPVVVLERLTTAPPNKFMLPPPKLKIKKKMVYFKPKLKKQTKIKKSALLSEKVDDDDTSSDLDEEETPLEFLKHRKKEGEPLHKLRKVTRAGRQSVTGEEIS
ncbi:uncharacterized protein LOC113239163 [Hyposmocoma kahamanoa]|uniref:uncharacterized protein LOC113239163 n=1 Tax=Hyposmocoma kahamanoa TaxID=1477025 RepID=UPI000E6D7908|nr:uncharacterized protein LOC113239163 [Hyposmocoma kahamanoa]